MNSKEIKIYQVLDQNNILLMDTINDMKNFNLLSSTYDGGYFYVTALNKLFIVDYTDPEAL